ncbi:MAG: hypothetical protein NTV52_05575 [Acidobacteria bacterium]|nr:hypothetical protein [Acidobacteriota bacterium]
MHLLIINFQLDNLSEADYLHACEAKTWLADTATNTYGGVSVWRDRQAPVEFQKSALVASVANHPNLTNTTARDFAVLESPIRATRGWIE